MAKFRAADYNEYNKRYSYYRYGYLHRLLDLLFKLCKNYNLKHPDLILWESDTGNQAELKNTMYLNINKRISLHQKIFKILWKDRNKYIIKQLNLF